MNETESRDQKGRGESSSNSIGDVPVAFLMELTSSYAAPMFLIDHERDSRENQPRKGDFT